MRINEKKARKKPPRADSPKRQPLTLGSIIIIPGPMTDGQKAAWGRFWRSIMAPIPSDDDNPGRG